MPTVKRNILLKILIILISITMFGFQDTPEAANSELDLILGSNLHGWVDVTLYGQYSSGSGSNRISAVWHPVNVFLPITGIDETGYGLMRGRAITFAQANARAGPATVLAGWPVYWDIRGSIAFPPDCTVELFIDELWLPGYEIGCEPTGIVGCMREVWPPDFVPEIEIKIPFERAWGDSEPRIGGRGIPVVITAIVNDLKFGETGESSSNSRNFLGCNYNFIPTIPIIPQAP